MRTQILVLGSLALIATLAAPSSFAAPPAQNADCYIDQLRTAGKGYLCEAKQRARVVRGSTPAGSTKCADKAAQKWSKILLRYGTDCLQQDPIPFSFVGPQVDDLEVWLVPTTTTTTSTTTTTLDLSQPLCCSFGGNFCTWGPPAACAELLGTPSGSGTACDGVSGGCTGAPPQPGPCCEYGGYCITQPGMTSQNCSETSGINFVGSAICTVDGDCL